MWPGSLAVLSKADVWDEMAAYAEVPSSGPLVSAGRLWFHFFSSTGNFYPRWPKGWVSGFEWFMRTSEEATRWTAASHAGEELTASGHQKCSRAFAAVAKTARRGPLHDKEMKSSRCPPGWGALGGSEHISIKWKLTGESLRISSSTCFASEKSQKFFNFSSYYFVTLNLPVNVVHAAACTCVRDSVPPLRISPDVHWALRVCHARIFVRCTRSRWSSKILSNRHNVTH